MSAGSPIWRFASNVYVPNSRRGALVAGDTITSTKLGVAYGGDRA